MRRLAALTLSLAVLNFPLAEQFVVRNLEEVTHYLQQDTLRDRFEISLDFEDLLNSILHTKLLAAVGECIEAKC